MSKRSGGKPQKLGFFRRAWSILASRVAIIAALIIVQIVILVIMISFLSGYSTVVDIIFRFLSLIVVFFIIKAKESPEYKIAWIIPILLFPVFGGLLYFLLGGSKSTSPFVRQIQRVTKETENVLEQDHDTYKALLETGDFEAIVQSAYLFDTAKYPVYQHTKADYFTSGELFFPKALEDLRNAEEYIFLEFFIVEEGILWDTFLSILKEKADQGVEVCLLYDDIGSLFTLPANYVKVMESYGIHCRKFNPLEAKMTLRLNNRNHRKALIIDGKIAYTGGCNLADEYINAFEKYGHWKDVMIRLEGASVYTLTVTFLQTWNSLFPESERMTPDSYQILQPTELPIQSTEGFYQPYADSPVDKESIAAKVYRNMISRATRYVYIMTPYLILDQETIGVLTLAAESGIDVRIITPHIPDKKMVFEVTQSYYTDLLASGVRIFEYTPGFIHAKTIVIDDIVAVAGSINFDFRSLYLHFENGVWMYKSPIIKEMYQDFLDTQSVSQEITLSAMEKTPLLKKTIRSILQIFGPMM